MRVSEKQWYDVYIFAYRLSGIAVELLESSAFVSDGLTPHVLVNVVSVGILVGI
jgi:hypothetical protein